MASAKPVKKQQRKLRRKQQRKQPQSQLQKKLQQKQLLLRFLKPVRQHCQNQFSVSSQTFQ